VIALSSKSGMWWSSSVTFSRTDPKRMASQI